MSSSGSRPGAVAPPRHPSLRSAGHHRPTPILSEPGRRVRRRLGPCCMEGGHMVFQHGIGGSQDLPDLAAARARRRCRCARRVLRGARAGLARAPLRRRHAGPPAPGRAGAGARRRRPCRGCCASSGCSSPAYVAWAAIAGPDNVANPTFGVVYVLLWVGLVPASLLFGPFYRAVNPVRTLHWLVSRVTGGDPGDGVAALPALGRAVAGRPGAARLRLAGAGLPRGQLPRAPCGCGSRCTPRCCSSGRPSSGTAGSPPPTPSRSTRRWSATSSSSGGARTARWSWRSPLANLDGVPACRG